jgi:naphthoate synthase
VTYEDVLVEREGRLLVVTINRPDARNMLRKQTALELADALRAFRHDPALAVAILTGAGTRDFCIGGEHDEAPTRFDYSEVMPVVDVYELLDTVPKPVIAAVNGFAVGGGNVLQVMCDVSIAAESAVFRQVGPLVGSFDAGYGTWYLEEAIGRRRAKEMWMLNRRYTAAEALAIGLVNEVVRDEALPARAREVADELTRRGPQALAALKAAFSARHTGVAGQARIAHDLLLTRYRASEEAQEMHASFSERRSPDPERLDR